MKGGKETVKWKRRPGNGGGRIRKGKSKQNKRNWVEKRKGGERCVGKGLKERRKREARHLGKEGRGRGGIEPEGGRREGRITGRTRERRRFRREVEGRASATQEEKTRGQKKIVRRQALLWAPPGTWSPPRPTQSTHPFRTRHTLSRPWVVTAPHVGLHTQGTRMQAGCGVCVRRGGIGRI